ncbi:MAG: ABC transporter substrate-binding protein [Candidatus Aminicenantes bacterium]|nr:ABC transporter substrate-binding protein [Candidatus Aminicenantes bacterium]
MRFNNGIDRKLKKRLAFALFLIFICVLVIIGVIVKKPVDKEPGSFKIGIVSWVGFGPFYIAEEKGFFKEEGVNGEVWKIENDGALRGALASGELKGIIGSLDSIASGIASGLKAKVVLKIDESSGSDGILAVNSVKNLKDLRGKKVAFPKGVPSHFFLLTLLRKEGMNSKDIIPVYMEAGNAAVAFMAGKVDAAVTWEPWLSKANKPEYGHKIISSAEAPGIIVDLFAFSYDTLENQKEEAVAVLKAWFRAIDFLKENPKEGCEIIGRNMGIKPEEVTEMLKGLRFSDYKENLQYFKSGEFALRFDEAIEIYKQEGLIQKKFAGFNAYDVTVLSAIEKTESEH